MVYDLKNGCVRGEDLDGILPISEITSLTFERLRTVGYARAIGPFKHDEGLTDWSPAEWSNAMAGECGEACNMTKKMLRDGSENVDMEEMGHEIADVVIYADLLATRLGFKLEDLIVKKFNKVSEEKNSDLKL